MTLLKTSFISKITLFLIAPMLSISTMAAPDFNQTQRLANQGDSVAQNDLGVMYDKGEGVRQDYSKAIEWYQKSANQGLARAQSNLGGMYSKGWGVRQDQAKAFYWFQKSASKKDAYAQYNLAIMYFNGKGVRQNKTTAKEWSGKACDNGNQEGCDFYRELNEQGY